MITWCQYANHKFPHGILWTRRGVWETHCCVRRESSARSHTAQAMGRAFLVLALTRTIYLRSRDHPLISTAALARVGGLGIQPEPVRGQGKCRWGETTHTVCKWLRALLIVVRTINIVLGLFVRSWGIVWCFAYFQTLLFFGTGC